MRDDLNVVMEVFLYLHFEYFLFHFHLANIQCTTNDGSILTLYSVDGYITWSTSPPKKSLNFTNVNKFYGM